MARDDLTGFQPTPQDDPIKQRRLMLLDALYDESRFPLQCQGIMYERRSSEKHAYCALGVASVVAGLDTQMIYNLPDVCMRTIQPYYAISDELGNLIINLNDDKGWSFQQIARWMADEWGLYDWKPPVKE